MRKSFSQLYPRPPSMPCPRLIIGEFLMVSLDTMCPSLDLSKRACLIQSLILNIHLYLSDMWLGLDLRVDIDETHL